MSLRYPLRRERVCLVCGKSSTRIWREKGKKSTGFCDKHDQNTLQRYTYNHDTGGAPQVMEIVRNGFDGEFYSFTVRTTDATDYERLQALGILYSYQGNPTFKRE